MRIWPRSTAVPYHVVSTHTKYAPSQQRFLAPLDGFDTSDFFPPLLDLAEIGGALYGIPRNIDLRLLHYRTDRSQRRRRRGTTSCRWPETPRSAPDFYGFVFTGMESGLFGTFFELAESAGARIFPPSLVAEVNNEGGRWALEILRELYASGAVPAGCRRLALRRSPSVLPRGTCRHGVRLAGLLRVVSGGIVARARPVPPGAHARGSVGPRVLLRGIAYLRPHTCRAGRPEARELLRFLTAPEQQAMEARQGSVPVRRSVMQEQRQAAQGEEADRLALLGSSIEHDLIIPPKLAYYPHIEDILWRNVRAAMTGETTIARRAAGDRTADRGMCGAMLLENKVVFLDRGGQRHRPRCALACAREGASVVVADVDLDQARKTAANSETPRWPWSATWPTELR